MLVYFICFALFLSIVLVKNKRHFYFTVILLFSIMGLRDMVGSMDIYNYAYSYEMYDIKNYLKYDTAEIGFQLYTIFLKLFSDNRYFYFFITAFALGFLQLFSAWKLTGFQQREFYLLSFIILCKFFLLDFIVLRQLMAIGFVWLAFSYYYQSERIKALIFFIIALSFHRSMLILLPFVFLMNFHINFKKMGIIYALFLILMISGGFYFLMSQMLHYISYVPYLSKASAYASNVPYYKWIYLVEVPIIVATLYGINNRMEEGFQKRILMNTIFFYGIFTIISIVNPILIRMAWALFIAFAYGISYIVYQNFSKKMIPYIKSGVILYFSIVFFKFLFTYYGGDMIPYKSIFDNFDRKGHFDYKEYRKK